MPQPADQTPTPGADANQPWGQPQTPVADTSQPWGQPQPQYGGGFAPPPVPPAKKSGGRSVIWPIACIVLVLALIGVSAFSFMTITNDGNTITNDGNTLTDTKNTLNAKYDAEAKAHKADVAALSSCITKMTADEADLTTLSSHLVEVEAARDAYETALLKSLTDEHQAIVDMVKAATLAEYNKALALAMQGESEMTSAKTLKTSLDSLISKYGLTSAKSAASTIAGRIATTTTQCTAAVTAASKSTGAAQPTSAPKSTGAAQPSAGPSSH
ncbi:MAG TPA: hypothetical protein VF375_07970 [Candidatus Limnocylindrales bacterium]